MLSTTGTRVLKAFNDGVKSILLQPEKKASLCGHVCIACDTLVKRADRRKVSVKQLKKLAPFMQGDPTLHSDVRNHYTASFAKPGTDLFQALLSPRSHVLPSHNKRKAESVVCCSECNGKMKTKHLQKSNAPRFALFNAMAIGIAPPCLQRLNDVELAMISQARFRGHLFSFWGGCHRSIKGWHSFYKVNPSHTMSSMNSVSALTSSDNIAVVLTGPFTPEQKAKVKSRTVVRVEMMEEAFLWLKANNPLCHSESMPQFQKPIITDNSTEVESENTDIETKEDIKVIFPDGTASTGGCATKIEFEKAVSELKLKTPTSKPFVISKPTSEILRDYEDENLLRAFPLQFPYGYGSHNDLNVNVSQNGYLIHLSKMSIPAFHTPEFVLVMHNMFERSRALTGAAWKVMGGNERCDLSGECVQQ